MNYYSENDIRFDLKNRKLKNCYLFFGDEQFQIKRYIHHITNIAVEGNPEFNLSTFEGSSSLQQLYDSVVTFPLMSAHKAVLLCDFPIDKCEKNEFDTLLKSIEDIAPTTVLVIWFESVEVNPKKLSANIKKLFSAIENSGGVVCNVPKRSTSELIKLIQAGATKRNCSIDLNTARHMLEICSTDLGTVVNELEKLCSYTVSGPITVKTVDKICTKTIDAYIFNLAKQIAAKNLDAALHTVNNLFFTKIKATTIVMNLSDVYCDIYRAFAAKTQGKKSFSYAKYLGYPEKLYFRLENADKTCSSFTEKQIVNSLREIRNCDRKLKSCTVDEKTAVEQLVVSLVVIKGAENG